MDINTIHNMDCLEGLRKMSAGSVDMVLTSPPYDNLRKYNGYSWDFESIAKELYRVVKDGGVVIWVVGDATVDGSETGSSFRQALYFKDLGFNLYDTMIYRKKNYVPLTHKRYEQEWEYMFVFSKGKPNTFNPIMIPCKYAGQETWGSVSYHKTSDSGLVKQGKKKINDFKQHGNIFEYMTGSIKSKKGVRHPAPFPEALAEDMISSWSNEGDLVLDPFMGSGTTGKMAKKLGRNYIGFEISEEYCEMALERING